VRSLGLSPDEFWGLNVRELWLERGVAKLRDRRDHEQTVCGAWWGEVLHRQKTVPKLESLLRQHERRQTTAEQLAVLHMLSAQYGGTIRSGRNGG